MAEIKKVIKNWTAYDVLNSDTVVDAVIPSQTWNSWKFLTTNGSAVSWETVDALPSQSWQSWKFLTTDWTDASWETVDALPSQTSQSWKFLTTDGSDASWIYWANISTQSNNILTSGVKLWAWTQSDYESLGTYDNSTIYLTI